MRHPCTRVPSWCVFSGGVLVVFLICSLMVQQTSTRAHHPAHQNFNGELSVDSLQLWDIDDGDEYSLKLKSWQSLSGGPRVRYYQFDVASKMISIDGVLREVTAINGRYPGPLIEAVEGDLILVNVVNSINKDRIDGRHANTALHFHGMLMNGTNFYDGAVGATQCAIGPGRSFMYAFRASSAGTFWYHSHWSLQQVSGLVGPLIVHARPSENNFREIEDEVEQQQVVLILTDLYDQPVEDLMLEYLEPWIGGNTEPIPDIALAQGKRQPMIRARRDTKLRVRIINACSYTAFDVKLDDSTLKVIEADSSQVTPTELEHLLIYPAQRYSILIDLNSSTWLHTTPQVALYGDDSKLAENLLSTSRSLRTFISVDNEMKSSDVLPPRLRGTQLSDDDLVEPYFYPIGHKRNQQQDHHHIIEMPEHADFESIIEISMNRSIEGEVIGALNGKSFHPSSMQNALYSLFASDHNSGSLPQRHHGHGSRSAYNDWLFRVDDIKVVDLIIKNLDDGPHPVHLHGHEFWILERGVLHSDEPLWMPPDPLRRDTVWLPESQWVRVRIVTDNPGVWTLHCHIPWHSGSGMAGLLLSLPSKLLEQRPPLEWYGMCGGTL